MTAITAKKVILKDENGGYAIPFVNPASTEEFGVVKVDGKSIVMNDDGSIQAQRVIGQIIPVTASEHYVPEGTLYCDGAEKTATEYPSLWDNYLSAIGWNYHYEDFVDENAVVENQYMSFTPNTTGYTINEGVDWALCFNLSDVTTSQDLCSIDNTDMGNSMLVRVVDGQLNVTLFGSLTPITDVSIGELYVKREDEMLWYSINGTEWEAIFSIGSGATQFGFSGSLDLSKSHIGGVNLATPAMLFDTCSYAEYETELTMTGSCYKWAVDTANEKFRIPFIPDKVLVDVADTVGVKGNGITIGLTNGTTNYGMNKIETYGLSAEKTVYGEPVGTTDGNSFGTNGISYGLTTDASKSGIIADTTNAKTYKTIRHYVVVATGSINQSEMDWSAWASGLQGKANIDGSNFNASVKNFDGQWVESIVTLSGAKTTSQTIDLSEYLPNDGYNYEVMFAFHFAKAGDITAYFGTDVIKNIDSIMFGFVKSNCTQHHDTIVMPVGTERYCTVNLTAAPTSFMLAAMAYRRIGTNQ